MLFPRQRISNVCTLFITAITLNPLFSDKGLLPNECGYRYFSQKSWSFIY